MANALVASGANASMDDLPLWEQPTSGTLNYTGIIDRTLIDTLYPGEGVLGAQNSLQVKQRQAGANFTVDVLAGSAVIQGDSVSNQGKYVVRSVGTVNIPWAGGAPASGTRTHRIIAKIRDNIHDASGSNDWTLEWLEDTGTGLPAEPANAISLASVSIAAGQSSVLDANITDLRYRALGSWPGGQVARIVQTSNVSTTTEVVGPTATFRARSDRRYRLVYNGGYQSTVGGDLVTFRFRWAAGSTVTTSSTAIRLFQAHCAGSAGATPVDLFDTVSGLTTGIVSVAITIGRAGGTGTVQLNGLAGNNEAILVISDEGPA